MMPEPFSLPSPLIRTQKSPKTKRTSAKHSFVGAKPRESQRPVSPWLSLLSHSQKQSQASREHGVALILVLFIVALASVIVIDLSYLGTLEGRENMATARSLQAEYLAKSAVGFGQALIMSDKSPDIDGPQDVWAKFAPGAEIPLALLGIEDPALRVQVEIRPEDSKLPIRYLIRDKRWRTVLARLFRELGFDEDQEQDHTGLLPGRVLGSNELVAALIDYMDSDEESFEAQDFPGRGIESEIPKGIFPNSGSIQQVSELAAIPGFTPARMRILTPFIRTRGRYKININFAPELVLRALADEMTQADTATLMAFRNGPDGPFGEKSASLNQELIPLLGEDLASKIVWVLDTNSTYFQVISKIDYGSSAYFARAYLSQSSDGEYPTIRSLELF